MEITYTTNEGMSRTIKNVFPFRVNLYRPARTMVTFLPRALQPRPAAGGGGTSNPIGLTDREVGLLMQNNPLSVQRSWLIKDKPGWLYRWIESVVYWSSAVALADQLVLVNQSIGDWLHVVGIPVDAMMDIANINPVKRPYWCHRVLVGNAFQKPHDPFGTPTYSMLWDRLNRPNDYFDGSLWIKREYVSYVRSQLPWIGAD